MQIDASQDHRAYRVLTERALRKGVEMSIQYSRMSISVVAKQRMRKRNDTEYLVRKV